MRGKIVNQSSDFPVRRTGTPSQKSTDFKSKEMLPGPLSKLSIPALVIDYNSIERVCGFKLLGVYISNDLSWNLHVDYICSLLTDLLCGIPPSSDQVLNTAQLFGTTA